jgi:hypothetical protein
MNARHKAQEIVDSWDLDERLPKQTYEGLVSAIVVAIQEAAKVEWPDSDTFTQIATELFGGEISSNNFRILYNTLRSRVSREG